MRHPAFDTNSDIAKRKNDSQKQQKKTEEQTKQQQSNKQQNALSANTSAASSAISSVSSLSSSSTTQTSSTVSADLEKTPSQPITSADVQAKLSSTREALSAQQNALSAALSSQSFIDDINATLSAVCTPIYSALEQLKKIPPKLRSVVDIEGAKNSMYASLDDLKNTYKSITTTSISSEVPITLDDYKAAPGNYPRLETMQRQTNSITEADCLSSGYKKVIWTKQTQISSETQEVFQNPEEKDTVAKNAEKIFSSTIKTMWTAIEPPIQMIAGIANVGPIGQMVTSVVEAIDGIVKLASTEVPEEKLDQKVKQDELATEAVANEAKKATVPDNTAKSSPDEQAEKAKEEAKSSMEDMKNQADEALKSAEGAFAKLKMPPMPDGIGESLSDMKDAVIHVALNIQNILVVVLFKLLEAVFKCFNQIIGVIGVPTMPYPLNVLPQLITQAIDIVMFVMGLPMSLMNQVKAIVKRKVKASVVSQTPTPPIPKPTQTPVAPTSEDVPKPDMTWKDVREILEKKYKFSNWAAKDMVSNAQKFFDGSDSKHDRIENGVVVESSFTTVLVTTKYKKSPVKTDSFDVFPISTTMKRIKLEPQAFIDEWVPANLGPSRFVSDGEYGAVTGEINIPKKHIPSNRTFYTWRVETDDEGNEKFKETYHEDRFSWEMRTYLAH